MNLLKHSLFCFLGGLSFCLYGQEEDTLDEIVILPEIRHAEQIDISLPKRLITNQLVTDVGQLMLFFPGVQLKSYGDIGGLKTVSFRSLGAGHTAFVQDNQQLSTTQSGQADLSQVPNEFVQKLSLITLAPQNLAIPIHAKLSGAVIAMESKHLISFRDSSGLVTGIQAGSFQLMEGTLFGKIVRKKWGFTLSGKARSYTGNYPFKYLNGNTIENARRQNNSLTEQYGTASIHFKPNDKQLFRLIVNGNNYHKNLAGAVIFYNPSIDQYVSGYGASISLQHQYTGSKWHTFTRFNYQKNNLQYVDSSYLNNQGYLDSRFHSNQLDGDFQAGYLLQKQRNLSFGTSGIYEQMNSRTLSTDPFRHIQDVFLGFSQNGKFNWSVQAGNQTVFEKRQNQLTTKNYLLPAASIGVELNQKQSLHILYRYTSRLPTFSELYYQQIGNTNLKTEKAQIMSIRYTLSYSHRKSQNATIIEPFYARVDDKILAVPTKNLFIWSIRNIAKTEAWGLELTDQYNLKVKKSTFGLRVNYTFQYAMDISDPNSSNYRSLLSYAPLHSGSAELSWRIGKWYAFTVFNGMSSRYSLSENIPSNEVPGFYTLDFGISYPIRLGRGQLNTSFQLRNLTNQYNSYIAYFILPGINGSIRLTYGF